MAAKKKNIRAKPRVVRIPSADEVIAQLERMATRSTRDGMVRYGLPSDKAFGVPVGRMKEYAKELGRSHELAAALWKAGWYETRMMAAFVDEPERVTPAQMDRWCRDFDNWGIVDTVCFSLFDRSAHALTCAHRAGCL
jgi:3-methyladenine DNA glycosylase AlkD